MMCRSICLLFIVPLIAGPGCDPATIAHNAAPIVSGDHNILDPASGDPAIQLDPSDQDIGSSDYAIVAASTTNVPQAGSGRDGIKDAGKIRWTITGGSGVLYAADPDATKPSTATTIDTDPATEFGFGVLFLPNTGFSGEATITAELIQITHFTDEAAGGVHDVVAAVASSSATIHVQDQNRLKLTPASTRLPIGGSIALKAYFEAPEGTVAPLNDTSGTAVTNTQYDWSFNGLAGAGSLDSSPDSAQATFNAGLEEATYTISVKVTQTRADGSEVVNGPAKAIVRVQKNLRTVNTFGYWIVQEDGTNAKDPSRVGVAAVLYFPRIAKAISYSIYAVGFNDPAYYGDHASWSFTPDSAGNIAGVESTGGDYYFGLAGIHGPVEGYSDYIAGYTARFAGLRVLVSAVVEE